MKVQFSQPGETRISLRCVTNFIHEFGYPKTKKAPFVSLEKGYRPIQERKQ